MGSATRIFSRCKPERTIAKTANFNLVYGGNASNLMTIINENGASFFLSRAFPSPRLNCGDLLCLENELCALGVTRRCTL